MMGRGIAAATIAAAATLSPVHLDAHRLDEYLQATRLSIALDRVDLEVDLTPGAALAERIAADIDSDLDGQFSPAEADTYARGVLATLTLSADTRALALTLGSQVFPDRTAMLEGLGTIRLRLSAAMPRSSGGRHTLEFRNGYRPEVSVYLANTLVPEDRRITIGAQDRDPLQQRLTVTYDVASSRTGRGGTIAACLTVFLILAGRRRRFRASAEGDPQG